MLFSKKSGHPSLAYPEILAFGSHSSVNFQPILDCFISDFKLKYQDSENIKSHYVNIVVFNFHQIKRRAFFSGTPGIQKLIKLLIGKSGPSIHGVIHFGHLEACDSVKL